MPEQVFTLSAATINLYLIDGDGAVVADPVWMGACAEGLRMAYRFEKVVSRPTGVPYPKVHHINEEHEVTIDRVWVLNGGEFEMQRNQRFILVIEWEDSDWEAGSHKRTYYGVTNNSADLVSQEVHELKQNQVFNAEYFIAENTPS